MSPFSFHATLFRRFPFIVDILFQAATGSISGGTSYSNVLDDIGELLKVRIIVAYWPLACLFENRLLHCRYIVTPHYLVLFPI